MNYSDPKEVATPNSLKVHLKFEAHSPIFTELYYDLSIERRKIFKISDQRSHLKIPKVLEDTTFLLY